MKNYKILIKTDQSFYPVIIGKNILINISNILKKNKIFFQKCLIVYDSNVPQTALNILKQKLKNKNVFVYKIKSSEKVKNINTVNKDGMTALHIAAMKSKNSDMMKLLIEQGADITSKTNFGETAFDLASENELLIKSQTNF